MKKPEYNVPLEDQLDWIINVTLDIIDVISFLNMENISGDEKTDALNTDEYIRISSDIVCLLFDAMCDYVNDSKFFSEHFDFDFNLNPDTLIEEIQDLDMLHMFKDRSIFLKNVFLVGEYAIRLNKSAKRFRLASLIDINLGKLLINSSNHEKAIVRFQKHLTLFEKNSWFDLYCSSLLSVSTCYKSYAYFIHLHTSNTFNQALVILKDMHDHVHKFYFEENMLVMLCKTYPVLFKKL
jgi:hypothetical protein